MRVLPIIENKEPAFKARLINSLCWCEYMLYLKRHQYPAAKDVWDSSTNLVLAKKIQKAFNNHPSDAEINISVIYQNDGLYNTRGIIESKNAKFYDVEPAPNGSVSAPVENILRRILNPKNKNAFNLLVGEKYAKCYDSWWNENIKPIWNDITQFFREETTAESEHHSDWDKKMNELFQEKNFKNTENVKKSNKPIDLTISGYLKKLFEID